MISLPHHLPFVRVGSNSLTICQQEWLDQTLTDAVSGTNVPEWLAIDISKGVKNYLEKQYHGTVIDSEVLFDKIGTTLTSIGLAEVAANLDKNPPPLRISLTDLARRAGQAYELAFFQLLEDKCQEAIESGASCVECHGLQPCVRMLRSNRRWSMSSEKLRKEIESRIDECRVQGELANPIFNVSVTQ